jgi:hypothetical protein
MMNRLSRPGPGWRAGLAELRRGWVCALAVLAFWAAPVRAERVLTFSGTGGLVLPKHDKLRFGGTGDFCLELWVKPANPGAELAAIFTGSKWFSITGSDQDTNGGWGLYWQSGFRVARRPSTGKTAQYTPPNGSIRPGFVGNIYPAATGVWHHVAVNFDRDQYQTLFVDGVLVDSGVELMASWAYYERTFDGPEAYRIGSDPDGAFPFKGSVDEVRFWNRLRTADEVAAAYKNRTGLGGSEPGLVAYYRLNEPSLNAQSLGTLGNDGIALLLNGPARVEDAALSITAVEPATADYALRFSGSNQSLETGVSGSRLAGRELTIDYWFTGPGLRSAVAVQSEGRRIISGLLDGRFPHHVVNPTGTNDYKVPIATSTGGVEAGDGRWRHIAMTWRSGATGGFKSFVDGSVVARIDTPDLPLPPIDKNLWIGSVAGGPEFLNGQLEEVRVWHRELSEAEIKNLYEQKQRVFEWHPDLTAYFHFNDYNPTGAVDIVTRTFASFRGLTADSRVVQATLKLTEPQLLKVPNPASAGLWLGEISLHSVNEASAGGTNPLPAGGTFDFNILLHADATGAVRLLKDVTVMQKRNSASNLTELVLLTRDSLMPEYEGVIKRAGKLVGARYSSAFYAFDGESLPFEGGIGLAFVLSGTNTTPASLPTSPFKHLYHPVHKDPRDLQGTPYDIQRRIEIVLRGQRSQAGEGRDRIRGVYRETITGLHRTPLNVEGDISLERISLVNKLNNQ